MPRRRPTRLLLPENQLPGTREEHTSLREGLRKSGTTTFVVLAIIVALDNLQSSGLATLAPNIRASLHVSSGVIVFVAGVSGGFLVLGILPMGWLADRYRRGPIVGIATLVFGCMVFFTGLATNIFLFFLRPFRSWCLAGLYLHRARIAAGRHLSHQPARSDRLGHGCCHRYRHRAQSRSWSVPSPAGSAGRTGGVGPSTSFRFPSFLSP